MEHARPSRREDFEIAIICALTLEYDAVTYAFDEFFDEDGDAYGKAEGDSNLYTTGRIGKHSVVLVLLPHIGKVYAGSAAASIGMSFTRLRLVLLVGICGGVPRIGKDLKDEVLLGDVVISSDIVQYDFGRRYPDRFVRKNTVKDNASRPNKSIRSLLKELETQLGRQRHKNKTTRYLKELQARCESDIYDYPGAEQDKLFDSTYRHKHYTTRNCCCETTVCDAALNSFCEQTGCSVTRLVERPRLKLKLKLDRDKAQEPAVYVGSFATGDTVMKSAEDRDIIAQGEKIIAFEMEGGGVWEDLPCIIVKGVCDYADSHKNKVWQNFAAATAAAGMKALLDRVPQTDRSCMQRQIIREESTSQWTVRDAGHGGRFARRQQDIMMGQHHGLYASNFMNLPVDNRLFSQPTFQPPVVVMDARGKLFPVHLETIDSLELFIEVLKHRFKDLGLKKINRGEWCLENHHTGGRLDLRRPWTALMRPGLVLDMSMIFRRRILSAATTHCPSCRFENVGDNVSEIRCVNCSLIYHRIEEVKDIDIAEDDSRSRRTDPLGNATKPPPPSPRPKPPPELPDDDDDISQYARVQIIDTSFRIQEARGSEAVPGARRLIIEDLNDPETLATYLATVYGLPEADCLLIIQECGPQLQAIKAERKRRPTHAYQFGNNVIVEDELGNVLKQFALNDHDGKDRKQQLKGARRDRDMWTDPNRQPRSTEPRDPAIPPHRATAEVTEEAKRPRRTLMYGTPPSYTDDLSERLARAEQRAVQYMEAAEQAEQGPMTSSKIQLSTTDFMSEMQHIYSNHSSQEVENIDGPGDSVRVLPRISKITRRERDDKNRETVSERRRRWEALGLGPFSDGWSSESEEEEDTDTLAAEQGSAAPAMSERSVGGEARLRRSTLASALQSSVEHSPPFSMKGFIREYESHRAQSGESSKQSGSSAASNPLKTRVRERVARPIPPRLRPISNSRASDLNTDFSPSHFDPSPADRSSFSPRSLPVMDTGSDDNFISLSMATKLGLKMVDEKDERRPSRAPSSAQDIQY